MNLPEKLNNSIDYIEEKFKLSTKKGDANEAKDKENINRKQ